MMKKLLLSGSALLMSFAFASAQTPGWSEGGLYDDFNQEGFYLNGPDSTGIYWGIYDGTNFRVLDRDGAGTMDVAVTEVGGTGSFPYIVAEFFDGNTMDFSQGADIELDIENTSMTDTLVVTIELEDSTGVKATFEPNLSDVKQGVAFGAGVPLKSRNGFSIPQDARATVRIDLSSVPASIGGFTEDNSVACDGTPFNCPATKYNLDITKIKFVRFYINAGGGGYAVSEADGDHTEDNLYEAGAIKPYSGTVKFYSFKMGTTITGIEENLIENSLSLYPNPTKGTLNVSFDAGTTTQISLLDIYGNKVYTTSATIGANKTTIPTSNLTSGVYILNVATEKGTIARKVIVE